MSSFATSTSIMSLSGLAFEDDHILVVGKVVHLPADFYFVSKPRNVKKLLLPFQERRLLSYKQSSL